METGDSGERASAERDTSDDFQAAALDGAAPDGRHAGRAWRWGLRLGGAVALLGLIAVAAVALGPLLAPLLPRPAAHKAPAPLRDITALQIPPQARSCIVASAWSPDSAQVAIVRDSVCDSGARQNQPAPTALIFDGVTGQLVNGFSLDAKILQGIEPASNARVNDLMELNGVTWTPDSQQIAAPFSVFPMSGPGPMMFGLAELTVRGPHIGDFQSTVGDVSPFISSDPPSHTTPHTITEWSLQAETRTLAVPPAYAYRWGADGALEPLAAAPGSPSGQAGAFSMWRSGRIWEVNALACAGGAMRFLPQPYIALRLATLAWSPDGRYLAQVSVTGRYDAPGAPPNATPEPLTTPTACSAGPALESLSLAPAHDAGLRAVLPLAASTGNATVDLEWRPDGQRLAALTFNVSGLGSSMTLYDCRTGAMLRRYTAGQFPINGQPGTGPAKNYNAVFTGGAWSPDGRRLLIEAVGTGAVPFIMGPGALGA
jgi:hypothetical protein